MSAPLPRFQFALPLMLTASLIGFVAPVNAQSLITSANANGIQAYNTYSGSRENVNLATGDLGVQIPLLTLPGRKGFDFSLGIQYDSNTESLEGTYNDATDTWDYFFEPNNRTPSIGSSSAVTGSWRFTLPYLQASIVDISVNPNDTTPTYCYEALVVTLPDGSNHEFGNRPYCWLINDGQVVEQTASEGPQVSESTDSTYFRLDTTNKSEAVLYLKDGTRIDFPTYAYPVGYNTIASQIEDTDGNIISIATTSSSSWSTTDTLGRQITITSNGTTSITITYKDSNGNTQTISLGLNSDGQLTSATLPTGLAYTFQYASSSSMQLTQINYPTGGYTQYTYGTFTALWATPAPTPGSAQPYPEVTEKAVCPLATGTCTTSQEFITTYAPTISGSITSNSAMNVTDPLGNLTTYEFTTSSASDDPLYPWGGSFSPREIQRQIYQGSSTLLRTIQTCYDNLSSCPTPATDSGATLPVEITTTLNDISPPLVAQTQMVYDTYTPPEDNSAIPIDNVIQKSEYDYGTSAPGALLRQTDYTWLKTNPVNSTDYTQDPIHILNRKASETVYNGSGTQLAETVYEYDNYTAGISTSGAVQHDSTFTSSYTYRGNLTATERWLNTSGAMLTTRNQYDDAGNILSTTDPNSNTTKFSYADSWLNTGCTPSGGNGAAYVTSTTNALNQVTSHTYNSCSGTMASTTDPNNQITSFTYDLMGRLIQTKDPDGGLITPCYTDTGGTGCTKAAAPLEVVTTTEISSSQTKISTVVADGLGRTVQTQLNSDPSGVDYVNTTYDGDGRVVSVSNPYRSTSDPTYGITGYTYDALNRKLQVTDPDGSIVSNVYSGNCTTVTDEQGKARQSCTDGLGRMTSVTEDPGASPPHLDYVTNYTYDALDDLLSVVQNGSRQRNFTYDSLSRLTQSENPEVGNGTVGASPVTYAYDGDSNLISKVAPAADALDTGVTVTITYQYDALNRLTEKTYSDGNPTVTYSYDQTSLNGLTITNGIGRRTGATRVSAQEVWSYDSMGRVLVHQRRNATPVTESFTYTYLLDGSVASIAYPSGLSLTYAYDGAERPISVVDQNGNTYANKAIYAPPGELQTATMDATANFTGLSVSNSYTPRLQPDEWKVSNGSSSVMDFIYCFSAKEANPSGCPTGTGDNGNVVSVLNNMDATRSQTFTYDALNRLSTGTSVNTSGTNCWGEQYGYDAWGNLSTITSPSGYSSCALPDNLSLTINTSNQISGDTYDVAGNLLTIPGTGGSSYHYDDDGRLTEAVTADVDYSYDPDGRRVEKSSGTLYWYGVGDAVLEETNLSGALTNDYVFFGGAMIARRDSSGDIFGYFGDHLESSRKVEEIASGASVATLSYDADFYPFGRENAFTNTSDPIHKFTGKERDAETGLDNFGARYNDSTIGRFMTPDWSEGPEAVPYANFTNPQTLNQYALSRDNPETFADLDGHTSILRGPMSRGGPAPAFEGGGCDICNDDSSDTTLFVTVNGEVTAFTSADVIENLTQDQISATASGNTVTITSTTFDPQTGTGTITTETLTGDHPFRDNNPGDIKSGDFATRHGAIGSDKGIAIFPNAATGSQALHTLLSGPSYKNLTVDQAVKRFAPPNENDTAAYQASVRSGAGVSGNTRMSALSAGQLASVEHTIAQQEGFFRPGTVTLSTTEIVPPF